MNFSEYLKMDEGLGNLKGLPKNFIDVIVGRKGYIDFNGQGGENSKIELYKTNAKASDITAVTKKVAGYVPPKDKGYIKYSQKEIEAQTAKSSYAAVAIKINDEWAYLASFDDYGDGTAKFMLVSNNGIVTKKDRKSVGNRSHPRIIHYDRQYLKASEIRDIIDFTQKVDIYLITVDPVRVYNRQKRDEERKNNNEITPERRKALIKFLSSKASKFTNPIKEEIKKEVQKINDYIDDVIERATTGKSITNSGIKLEEITADLQKKLSKINSIGYNIEAIIKDGNIKDYRGGDSWSYERFKEIIKEFEDGE